MLKIVGKQILGDNWKEEDQLELVTEGKYYQEDGTVFISYDESGFSGMEGCTTSLMIREDEILMKRCGESVPLDTEIRFEKGKRFTGYYGTPFGAVEMEVLTNNVVNKMSKNEPKGSIDIDYHISLRGLSEGRSRLNIEII
ncbi:MAG TPA: DUF1934 domain-containing protein [Anaerovoracaceae bacterium]|nr:DUF1934 domain-containing protein [Anaerovoracaceae bacterium]